MILKNNRDPTPRCCASDDKTSSQVPVPQSSQFGRTAYTAEPGKYQLLGAFPGFVPVSQSVEVKPAENGRYGPEHEVDLTLQRATEPPPTESH